MDILICQSCGIILRGKSKFCTGCGTTVSRFSPTTLPVIAHTAAPLAVTLEPDLLVLERAINRLQFATAGTRNGENGHMSQQFASSESASHDFEPAPPPPPPVYAGENHSAAGQAAVLTASKLQSILGTAAAASVPGLVNQSMSGLISLESSGEPPVDNAAPVPVKEEEPLAPPPSGISFYLDAPAKQETAAAPEPPPFNPVAPTHPGAAPAADSSQSSNRPGGMDTAPTASASSSFFADPAPAAPIEAPRLEEARQAEPPAQTEEAPGDIAPTVEPNVPVTVTSNGGHISPPGVISIEIHPRTVHEPKKPAEQATPPTPPPHPSDPAPGWAPINNDAPYIGAPSEGVAQEQPEVGPSSPARLADSPGASPSPPPAVAAPAVAAPAVAAPTVADFFANVVPNVVAQESSTALEPGSDGPPPLINPAALMDLSPAAPTQPAPSASTSDSAPPPASVAGASETASAPYLAQDNHDVVNSFNPIAGSSSSFDFFAPTTAAASAESSKPKPPAPAPVSEPAASTPFVQPPQATSNAGFTDIPAGTPSIVAAAMRAAASQTKLSPVMDGATPIVSSDGKAAEFPDFPDESVNRGKPKLVESEDKPSDDSKPTPKGDWRSREDSDDDSSRSKSQKEEPKMLSFGSFQIPQKMALTIGILILFVGFPIGLGTINAINNMFVPAKNGAAATSNVTPAGNANSLAGDWEFGVMSSGRGSADVGRVRLNQSGGHVSGSGVDAYGVFRIEGDYQNPKMQFQKVYVQGNRAVGRPITFAGKVDWVNPNPGQDFKYSMHMGGVWVLDKPEGRGWRQTVVRHTNKWEAGLISSAPQEGGQVAQAPLTKPNFDVIKDVLGVPGPGETAKWATFFAKIAGILLLLGFGIVMASIKMFGPSGLLNIWLKKEYIPSQYKSQHMKMVYEFGKPLKPGGLPLGSRVDWTLVKLFQPRTLAMPPEVRVTNPHMLVLGAGAKGKSRLLASMIAHDIEANDRAVVVIDSDGCLIDLMMSWVASHPKGADIARRLIVVDPTHGSETLAYNPLEFPEDGDLQNAASALVFGFKAIYTEPPGSQSQWNQQTANILRNSAILLMANGKTLTDLPVLLSENDFRDVLLEKIERQKNEKSEYTTLLEAWAQYKRLARTDQWINWVEPILNRVQPMLGNSRIRPILTKQKGDLNLKEIINEGKILFVKVPQGQLDQDANLLGSLLVTGLKQAALSISLKSGSRKHPCALYLDEFDSFIEKETFDAITSETKKFQIGLIGASKTLQGLPEDYRNQIIINVGTMCCFALAKKDGDLLGPQMFRVDGRKVKHQTLQNIFNKVNTMPNFELISDEEKLNIDRVVGQEERTFFCYRVGTVAGVFHLKVFEFKDIPDKDVNWTLIEQIYARSVPKE